jgi:hypothetical protein
MTTEIDQAPPRRRLKLWLLSALAAAILASSAWSCFHGFGLNIVVAPLEPVVIPNPNGYDDVLAAGRDIEKARIGFDIRDLDKADEATLSPLVQASHEAIAKGRQGLDRPFQVPVVYDLNDIINRLMYESAAIRNGLAHMLYADGRLAELQGRTDDSLRAYLDLVRLGDAMSHKVPTFPYLVSAAIETRGLHGLRGLRTKLSAEECRRVVAVLQQIDDTIEPVADAILRERHFMDVNVSKMGMVKRVSIGLSGVLAKDKARAAATLEAAAHRRDASRRLLLTDLALRAHRLEHGALPPGLESLVPSILKTVPIDPYSGKPLVYRMLERDFQLYSVGPDADDDHLAPTLPARHLETDNGDFTIDSF